MPTFSILTPVRNSEDFILDCLKSVQIQNANFEHLIQDGNSSDSTLQLIEEFKSNNSSVEVISEQDIGQSDALNKLLDRANGKYIGWLNSDETYLPGTLRRVAEIFEKTEADVVFGDCFFVDANKKLLRLYSNHKFSRILLRNLGCYIPSCATFYRRESLRNFQFDIRLKRCMDWDLYLSLIELKFRYIQKPLSTFAVHANQVTNIPENNDSEEFALLQAKHKLTRNPALNSPKVIFRIMRSMLKFLDGNYFREAFHLFLAKNCGGHANIWKS